MSDDVSEQKHESALECHFRRTIARHENKFNVVITAQIRANSGYLWQFCDARCADRGEEIDDQNFSRLRAGGNSMAQRAIAPIASFLMFVPSSDLMLLERNSGSRKFSECDGHRPSVQLIDG